MLHKTDQISETINSKTLPLIPITMQATGDNQLTPRPWRKGTGDQHWGVSFCRHFEATIFTYQWCRQIFRESSRRWRHGLPLALLLPILCAAGLLLIGTTTFLAGTTKQLTKVDPHLEYGHEHGKMGCLHRFWKRNGLLDFYFWESVFAQNLT